MSFSDFTDVISQCFREKDNNRLSSIWHITHQRLINEISASNEELEINADRGENSVLLNQWDKVKGDELGLLLKYVLFVFFIYYILVNLIYYTARARGWRYTCLIIA